MKKPYIVPCLSRSNMNLLNKEQKLAYNQVMESVKNNQEKLFFLHGPAGTGKTFVYNCKISAPVLNTGRSQRLVAHWWQDSDGEEDGSSDEEGGTR